MKKTNIILIILVILLIVMTLLYSKSIKSFENNQEILSNTNEELLEANKKIEVLENEIKKYKNSNYINKTNTLNTNTIVSSKPYVPDEIEVADENYSSDIKASDIESNRSPENVTIDVISDSVTREKANILITDNNIQKYSYGDSFRLQKKENNEWKEIEPVNPLNFISIAHNINDLNQLTLEINYEKYYGVLEDGIYRIVKSVYDNGYIDLFSNEFEIK